MREIIIGNQIWMAENLNVDTFRNGDKIIQASNFNAWSTANKDSKNPSWCYYEDNPDYEKSYGKLYNWYAVNDPRGLAPEGWHIPTDQEWQTLIDYLGGEQQAGIKMKCNSLWKIGGNNESGFSGLPGGLRKHYGSFEFISEHENLLVGKETIGSIGIFWSSTDNNINSAWHRYLFYKDDRIIRNSCDKGSGLSVRCIKD